MKTHRILYAAAVAATAVLTFFSTACDGTPKKRAKHDADTAEHAAQKDLPPIIVVVSPEVPAATVAELRAQAKSLVATLLGSAANGASIEWWDGLDPAPKVTLAVGDDPPKIRGHKLAGPVRQLGGFLGDCGKGDGKGRLNFPALCQALAQRGVPAGTHVVVVGGPLYLDAGADKYFSMDDGRVPLDGLFFKQQQESLYSVKGREQALAGLTFHWAYLGRAPFVDDGFRQRVTDCWAKYVSLQGGVLADFQPTVGAAFSAALARRTTGLPAPKADPTAPAVMQRVIKEIHEIRGVSGDAKTGAPGDEHAGTVVLGEEVRPDVQEWGKVPERQQTDTAAARLDRHGNRTGSTSDLVADGGCSGRIGLINFYTDDHFTAGKVVPPLERKGFVVERIKVPLEPLPVFTAHLAQLTQVWLFSSTKGRLPPEHAAALAAAWRTGRLALYIAGDNDPWYTEANQLLGLLFPGASLSGNDPGGRKVRARAANNGSGFSPRELLFAGITSLYEGDTVSAITCAGGLRPVLWGTQGKPVIAVFSNAPQRVVVDAGFTRVFPEYFDNAGTERLVVNCAGFLAGVSEAHADESPNRRAP